MKRRLVSAAVVLVIAPLVAMTESGAIDEPGPAAAASAPPFADGRYLVTFVDEPVASYEGYRAGYAATRPQPGRKLDAGSPAAQRWSRRLTAIHDDALAQVGATKIYDYTIASNGVAVQLTAAQAAALSKAPGVVALSLDELHQPATTVSPEYLGMDASGSIWSQLGGPEGAGAGVVVGVLDTGIWPESGAFAGGTGIPVPSTWRGACVAGEQFAPRHCNDKLIGARYYVEGFGRRFVVDDEYLSPRDGDGHGSHTASTAAGNRVSGITIEGDTIDDGIGSGMAPGAKVAAYKVCWTGKGDTGGCFTSDSVAAINDAVADGVDVLNYSIGGGSESDVLDPVAQAFRGASNAGVYVANSAGNSGPGASTFDHPAPWVTTVAAATFRRSFQAIELGNGSRFVGASVTPSYPAATQLVTSVGVKLAGASSTEAALCTPGSLDPALAAGKVVHCDRGVIDRIAKSFEVQRAGGVAMVMTNTSPNSLNGDYHPIPSVHVDHVSRAAIVSYIASAGPVATAKIVPLTASELAAAPQVPEIAAFSSRGPSLTTDGDILKPDIAAPGVDVVAAVAPPFHHGRDWDFLSGTSMSSPHMAGIGALIKAAHPDWMPSEIKSALMTTAVDTVSSANDPFAQGAGFVNPNAALDPGLVYPTTPNEHRSYLVSLGVQFGAPFDTLLPIPASNLNQASIGVGGLAGIESVTRRVRNVGTATATYTAAAEVPGFTAEVLQDGVADNSVVLEPGAEATFQLRFTRTDAPLGSWAVGALTWTDGIHIVRSPIALEPVAVAVPDEVRATVTPDGQVEIPVTAGFTGTLDTELDGLVGVAPAVDSVTRGAFDFENPVVDADTKKYQVTVPAGSGVARFALDAIDDASDLDLYVYRNDELVDLGITPGPDEQITLMAPEAGTYDVYVNGFAVTRGSSAYELTNHVVGPDDLANADVTSGVPVVIGEPTSITASWTGLDPTLQWLGVIRYAGSDDVTVLSVQ